MFAAAAKCTKSIDAASVCNGNALVDILLGKQPYTNAVSPDLFTCSNCSLLALNCAFAYTTSAAISVKAIIVNAANLLQHNIAAKNYALCASLLDNISQKHQQQFLCMLQQTQLLRSLANAEKLIMTTIKYCKTRFAAETLCSMLPTNLTNHQIGNLIAVFACIIRYNANILVINAVHAKLGACTSPWYVGNTCGNTIKEAAIDAFTQHNGTQQSAKLMTAWLQYQFAPNLFNWHKNIAIEHRTFLQRLANMKCTVLLHYWVSECIPQFTEKSPLNGAASNVVAVLMSPAALSRQHTLHLNTCEIMPFVARGACSRRGCMYNVALRAARTSTAFTAQKTIELIKRQIDIAGIKHFARHCKQGCHCCTDNSPVLYAFAQALNKNARNVAKLLTIFTELFQLAKLHNAVPITFHVYRRTHFNIFKSLSVAILDDSIHRLTEVAPVHYSLDATFEICNKLLRRIHAVNIDSVHKVQVHRAWRWMIQEFTLEHDWCFNAVLEPITNAPTMMVSACLHYAMTRKDHMDVWLRLMARHPIDFVFDTTFTSETKALFFSHENVTRAQKIAQNFFWSCFHVPITQRVLRTQLAHCFRFMKDLQGSERKAWKILGVAGFSATTTPGWLYPKEHLASFYFYMAMYRRMALRQPILCDELMRLICNLL